MKMTKKLTDLFVYSYSIILLIYISIKSYSNTITTDEVYSFLEYVYTGNIFNNGLANNHLLNTFLTPLTERRF